MRISRVDGPLTHLIYEGAKHPFLIEVVVVLLLKSNPFSPLQGEKKYRFAPLEQCYIWPVFTWYISFTFCEPCYEFVSKAHFFNERHEQSLPLMEVFVKYLFFCQHLAVLKLWLAQCYGRTPLKSLKPVPCFGPDACMSLSDCSDQSRSGAASFYHVCGDILYSSDLFPLNSNIFLNPTAQLVSWCLKQVATKWHQNTSLGVIGSKYPFRI